MSSAETIQKEIDLLLPKLYEIRKEYAEGLRELNSMRDKIAEHKRTAETEAATFIEQLQVKKVTEENAVIKHLALINNWGFEEFLARNKKLDEQKASLAEQERSVKDALQELSKEKRRLTNYEEDLQASMRASEKKERESAVQLETQNKKLASENLELHKRRAEMVRLEEEAKKRFLEASALFASYQKREVELGALVTIVNQKAEQLEIERLRLNDREGTIKRAFEEAKRRNLLS